MASRTVTIHAENECAHLPVVWRLGRLFHVVTSVLKARVSKNSANMSVHIDGTHPEVEQAIAYLNTLGMCSEETEASSPMLLPPEDVSPKPYKVTVRVTPGTPEQAVAPVLYRLGRDFIIVVTVARAAFDATQTPAGWVEVLLEGPLAEIQRAIAYLHTTGVNVTAYERSVTDYSHL